MRVYGDHSLIPAELGHYTSRWPHLFADTEEELHAFARILGLRRERFQPGTHAPGEHGTLWHHDVSEHKRQQAIQLSAIPHLIRSRAALADQADRTAGMGWRTGHLDRDERHIKLAKQLDPARNALWDKCLHTIEDADQQVRKPGDCTTSEWQASPGAAARRPQLSLAEEELAARLTVAGIEPTDPALATIRQWNAAFRRAHQAAPEPESAES